MRESENPGILSFCHSKHNEESEYTHYFALTDSSLHSKDQSKKGNAI